NYQFFFLDNFLPVYGGKNKLLNLIGHFRYQFWKQISLPLKAFFKGVDIVFCTDNVAPYIHLGYKTVPVFHDAFFFENPEHFNKIWLKITLWTALPAARRSPIVVTPSIYARQQIHRFSNIPLTKMPVIYEGPKSFKNQPQEHKRLIEGRYILHVGVLNKRKNIPSLINAFKILKDKGFEDVKLVLAGKIEMKKFSYDHDEIRLAVSNSGLENDIIFTGYLADEDLASLYRNASVYAFPSLNEGFGIPVLEAFKYNLPVLVSNNTSLPEIGGDAVLTFNPHDIQDIAAKLKMVLEDEILRQDLIKKGKERLRQFSWEKTAQSLLREFDKIR
ncbi:MAG: glycosyltransferase family 1 protein, partial [Pedobacter sp.]